ncbi:MAG: hypothetical protein FWC03_09080 [Treponema sp.]|nr:hypothetical protein [Treponema sp.]
MKKLLFLLICLIFPLFFIYGENEFIRDSIVTEEDNFPEDPQKTFRIDNRMFEIGLMNININLSNDFLTVGEIFRETLVLNINDLDKGLNIKLGAFISPFYINFNHHDNWGIGFSAALEAEGIIGISGNILSLSEAVNDKPDASGAVFAELRLGGFFHLQNFKIKINPALYYPLAYVRPDISYTFQNTNSGPIIYMSYDLRIYTGFPMENFPDNFSLTASPGFDFNFGLEYPLSAALGLQDKNKYLYFDVGLDFYNIPVVHSVIRNYIGASGALGDDEPLELFNSNTDWNSLFTYNEFTYATGGEKILRPFKMLAWIDWHPFGHIISIIPTLGFTVNNLYVRSVSPEAGLQIRLDMLNIFITTLAIGYHDRLWKNSIDLAFNSRAFEFNLGASFQSTDFVKSWTGGGFGLNMGIKLGW